MPILENQPKIMTESSKETLGVLIPCYNEENRIASVIARCQRFTNSIYVCDDGSTDLTAEIATKMGAKVIRHKNNLGYGAALRSLFDAVSDSTLKVVVTIDGDGQHAPEYIGQLVDPIVKGEASIVIGSRLHDTKSSSSPPKYRRLGIKVITATTNLTISSPVRDSQSGLRAYDARILRKITPSENDMSASTEILMKASSLKLQIKEIPVDIQYHEDSSTHNPVMHGLSVILGIFKQYSLKHALLSYGVPGFLSSIIAVALWALLLDVYASTGKIVTNVAILAIGFSVVGIVLITTAMILWTIISLLQSR